MEWWTLTYARKAIKKSSEKIGLVMLAGKHRPRLP